MQKQFLACCFSLGILGVSLIKLNSAIASPAAIFQPLIEDIRQQLPSGWVMRLPSSLPQEELYPYIKSDSEGLTVHLTTTPDCADSNNPTSCTAIVLVVSAKDDSEDWPPEGDKITSVNVSEDMNGYYFTTGEGDSLIRYLVWQQDGLIYGVIAAGVIISQEQVLNVANSMTNESPLESVR